MTQIGLSASKKFKDDFLDLSRVIYASEQSANGLHHSGEFGRYREQILRSFMTAFLPHRLGVGDGFLVTMDGLRSTQCDVIFYDRDNTPHLAAPGGLAMFPGEVCAAVGEVKSKLTFPELKEALGKLRATKKMRADMRVFSTPHAPVEAVVSAAAEMRSLVSQGHSRDQALASLYRPAQRESQNLVTFVVCEQITWPSESEKNPSGSEFRQALAELNGGPHEAHLRQNFILSLRQGFLSYYFAAKGEANEVQKIPYPYPVQTVHKILGAVDDAPADCGWRWLPAHDDHRHVMMFASELVHAARLVPIFPFTPQDHSLDPLSYDFTFIAGA